MSKITDALSKVGGGIKNKGKNLLNKGVDGLKNNLKGAIKKAIPVAIRIKIYIIGGLVVVAIVLIAALVQLLKDIFGKSDEATSIKVTTAEFQQQASKDGLELYNKYGSCIGFTLSQINELSDSVTSKDGVFKSNEILRQTYSSKFGYISDDKKGDFIENEYKKLLNSDGNVVDDLTDYQLQIVKYHDSLKGNKKNAISVYDSIPIYTHCLRAEKYNFNNINWKAYNHGESGKDVDKNEFAYDESLGLYYPTKGNPSLMDFIKEYSPYLMSSKIPAAYLASANYNTDESTSIGKSQNDFYKDKVQGKNSDVGNFAYLVLQYAQSDITVNQYNLKYINELTSWDEYDTYTSNPTFKVKMTRTVQRDEDGNEVKDENGNTKYDTSYSYVGEYNDGRSDTSRKGEHHNSRLVDGVEKETAETHVEWGENVITHYKISSVLAFDVNITWSYNYSQYEQSDVDNRTNWNSIVEQYDVAIDRLAEGSSIQGEENFSSLSQEKLKEYYDSGSDSGTSGVKICKGNEYQYELGNTHFIRREWQDTLNPEPTSQKKYLLGIKDLVNYNTNPKKDQNMETVKADDFNSDEKSINYYQTNIISADNIALNLVDIFNANPKLYNNYTTSSMAYAKYVGWTRNKYIIQQGDSSIKTAFKELEKDNDGKLPFAYGASFGFDVGAEEAPAYNASGSTIGKRLMYEYIYQLEGTGAMKEENGEKFYQIYTINGNRTVGHGLDLETSGKEGDLKALLERAGYSSSLNKGDWIPCDIVDEILDGEIDGWYKVIQGATANMNLQEFQIHALTSRAINAGYHSYMKYQSSPCNGSIDLAGAMAFWDYARDCIYDSLYEKYGSSELDSTQEADVLSNVDYNHELYSKYLAGPNNGGQLENRRKSEWVLFQTGYYGYNTNIKKLYGMSGGSILECAEYIHAFMEENNYTYCVYHGNSCEECTQKNPKGSSIIHTHGDRNMCIGLPQTFESSQSSGNYTTCCATFVKWVLQDAGYLEDNEGSDGADALASILENQKGFVRYSLEEAEAGDILVYSGHIEIYAGDGTKYNAGSGDAIRKDSPYSFGSPTSCGAIYCLRAPN